MRLPALLLASALFVAGCATTAPRSPEAGPPALASAGDLVTYLGQRGVILRPAGLTGPSTLNATGQQYRLDDGAALQVFEFGSARAAEAGVDDYRIAAQGGGTVRLFQRGPLLVAYYGGATTVLGVLTDALGPAVY